ncbi:hypothetical protein EGW08_004824 [Elysia chlorotica]|uniref:Glutathione transferase n=1 Tax=Elysia chlorotica TaxID=188477 RepID=A0A433U0P6_ELYCH|nr:hypothetical protein EGW08_004824 [Elysia chlorotica]
MATIKLHYFPVRCRAEVTRLVLHYAKRDFVDHHVTFSDWPAFKPGTPFGSLPYMELGDEVFGQGQAIASYVAREADLYGSSNLDALKIEQLQQLREDLIVEEVNTWSQTDEAKKARFKKRMHEDVYPKFLAQCEKLIKENQAKTESKYTVGDKLSLADFIIFEGTENVRQQNASLLDGYPRVKAVSALVAALDNLKDYLAKRPVWVI